MLGVALSIHSPYFAGLIVPDGAFVHVRSTEAVEFGDGVHCLFEYFFELISVRGIGVHSYLFQGLRYAQVLRVL